MHADRRQFLAASAATAALGVAPALSAAAKSDPAPLTTSFDTLVQAQLRRSPEGATQLGLDTGANADLRAKLSDQSASAIAADKARTKRELAMLEAIDRTTLSSEQQIDLDCVLFTRRTYLSPIRSSEAAPSMTCRRKIHRPAAFHR